MPPDQSARPTNRVRVAQASCIHPLVTLATLRLHSYTTKPFHIHTTVHMARVLLLRRLRLSAVVTFARRPLCDQPRASCTSSGRHCLLRHFYVSKLVALLSFRHAPPLLTILSCISHVSLGDHRLGFDPTSFSSKHQLQLAFTFEKKSRFA